MMKPIYLVGFMGSGKTTLGRAAARDMSLNLIDLDEYIEAREEMTVRQIFDSRGEAYFRTVEKEALEEVSRMSDVIIATGGGTPCQPGLMDIMLASGTTVFLDTPTAVLHRRLIDGRTTRPLIAKLDDDSLLDFIEKRMVQRRPHYERSVLRFDSSRLESAGEIARSVEEFRHLIEANDTD
ncbi:MAG: shikimate kinase [Clostridiales bacterium]|nr:shikimate kinase [Clostridiales bacterium]